MEEEWIIHEVPLDFILLFPQFWHLLKLYNANNLLGTV